MLQHPFQELEKSGRLALPQVSVVLEQHQDTVPVLTPAEQYLVQLATEGLVSFSYPAIRLIAAAIDALVAATAILRLCFIFIFASSARGGRFCDSINSLMTVKPAGRPTKMTWVT